MKAEPRRRNGRFALRALREQGNLCESEGEMVTLALCDGEIFRDEDTGIRVEAFIPYGNTRRGGSKFQSFTSITRQRASFLSFPCIRARANDSLRDVVEFAGFRGAASAMHVAFHGRTLIVECLQRQFREFISHHGEHVGRIQSHNQRSVRAHHFHQEAGSLLRLYCRRR